jgi:hypothetical protein
VNVTDDDKDGGVSGDRTSSKMRCQSVKKILRTFVRKYFSLSEVIVHCRIHRDLRQKERGHLYCGMLWL